MIDAAGFSLAVVAGINLLSSTISSTVEACTALHPGMAVGRIVGSRREPHHHADAVLLCIGREQLAGDAGATSFHSGSAIAVALQHRLPARLRRNSLRETVQSRCRMGAARR